ncbi:MAG TPA: tagaturonate reductase [Panacibacter sp.]|nr:tagaturonate reductase [Panacibacter sp.]HNP45886.1 tagaturonate reductase [Panacibacter sp.]
MQLSKDNLPKINAANVIKPTDEMFDLPDKVLQFGTGVLLRGLCDYFIDKANRNGIFNGRVVVVKSTGGGDIHVFEEQDNLYTICVRGVQDGQKVEENIICSAISKVLSAKDQWNDVLAYAHNRQMQIVISNTTEVGLQLVKESIHQKPPSSYPAKLLAFLYHRWLAFAGSAEAGMVIIPTELISENGKKLFSIVEELAHYNNLGSDFTTWLKEHNRFCNSLVDRIVPGKPPENKLTELRHQLGYKDELLEVCEHYRLWAIEGDYHEQSMLSFFSADKAVVIEPNIEVYKELKLRMLNATHTLTCGLACLCGSNTVKDGMGDAYLSAFISDLMLREIAQAIPCPLPDGIASGYGYQVLDRFRNPYLEHQWINITLQYSSKIKMRAIPVLLRYYELYETVPQRFALGFAAYILFMKAVKEEAGAYFGSLNGQYYRISDDSAAFFYELWKTKSADEVVVEVFHSKELWGVDLSYFYEFIAAVQGQLSQIIQKGALVALLQMQEQ